MPVRAVYVTADVVQKSFDARPGVGGSLRIRADAGHPEQRPQQARADSGVIEEGMPGCRVLLDVVLDPEAGKGGQDGCAHGHPVEAPALAATTPFAAGRRTRF